ncbi:hypothetical protein LPICM02_220072 [Pseudolactococcus piscium]|nr:hypothetical protein LPICM02_220072 [Lactococcus piscium]
MIKRRVQLKRAVGKFNGGMMKKKAKLVLLSMIILFLGLCIFFVFQDKKKQKIKMLAINLLQVWGIRRQWSINL